MADQQFARAGTGPTRKSLSAIGQRVQNRVAAVVGCRSVADSADPGGCGGPQRRGTVTDLATPGGRRICPRGV